MKHKYAYCYFSDTYIHLLLQNTCIIDFTITNSPSEIVGQVGLILFSYWMINKSNGRTQCLVM